jgi:hypothetical protein
MSKRKFARLAAVMTTLVAAVALISTVVASSGAYFTDSHGGAITGNLGTLKVAISGENINFANLMPGETQTQTVYVTNTGTGSEDIYLAFSNANWAWSAVNDLGQYGTFVINGQTYDNLNNRYAAPNPGVPGTGSGTAGPCGTPQIPINYLPHVIKLGTLTSGQNWQFDISFTFNACLSSSAAQGASLWGAAATDFSQSISPAPLNYVVAAFQPGVNPNDQMNGAGQIAPLSLPITIDTVKTPRATFQ